MDTNPTANPSSLTTNNEEIYQKILSGYKTITGYYVYPTGGNGLDNVIVETDKYDSNGYDLNLKNIVNLMVQLGAAAAGCSNDNKTAVRVEVDGLGFPVYFIKYDLRYYISRDVRQKDGIEPIKLHWNVEY